MYTAEVSRSNPALFVFLVDQSLSMSDMMADPDIAQPKEDFVADAINRLLSDLSIRCAKEDGIRDYFHVALIGYGREINPAFGGALAGKGVVPIGEVATNPARIEDRSKKVPDGAGGLVEMKIKFPVWLDPVSDGGTPMSRALTLAQSIVAAWLDEHPGCFPPVVLNLTDGEPTDGDPAGPARAIRELASTDGNVLLFNLHVSSNPGPAVKFPDSDAALPNQHAKALFSMSSVLPPIMLAYTRQLGYAVTEDSRSFVFNGGAEDIVKFIDIGTRPGLR